MSTPKTSTRAIRSVLISGASIAGPALAYWLDRYGFDVTVVERAPAIRSGGYPIDLRGTAVEVIERMGLLDAVWEFHLASRDLSFVDASGDVIASLPFYAFQGSASGDVELPRGALTNLLYGLTRDSHVHYRFGDSIETLTQDGAGVNVGFVSGDSGRYDFVIGADGLHSQTRRLVFGPETPFKLSLGQSFNLFTVPNDFGLSHGARIYAEPGRTAGLYAVGDGPNLFAFLIFATDPSSHDAPLDRAAQIGRTEAAFAGAGWEVPRLLTAARRAEDLYFDTVSQIRMPSWSKGRVVLVGDAAYAPSFRSGQGTSLALVGAYVLAQQMAAQANPTEAFAAYEHILRPFVEANQALALKNGKDPLLPRTREELDALNRMLAEWAANPGIDRPSSDRAQRAHNLLTLP